MSDSVSAAETTDVEWEYVSHADLPEPIVRRVPYVELKLEHPDLDPSRYGESFFPDAVPYASGDDHRVFYWRPTLGAATSDPSAWAGVCATTDSLSAVTRDESHAPVLVSRQGEEREATEIVVEGTIAGDSTTTRVESYAVPDVEIRDLSGPRVELLADEEPHVVSAGERRRASLSERTVELPDRDGGPRSVGPQLVVRFPGERELHHPALGAEYRLFPSFGLELDALPASVAVPRTNGELDYAALAESLGVELSARPYPERVLWQAFAYTAFDPHADAVPRLSQFPTGHLAALSEPSDER